ncbi:hypothetical protein EXN66_Car006600 [Channa argus]|uniref:Uncharacterized protein n=1 Tax=Channa argus TaxID=215402 RepID=A0A6G1PLP5_CHAAH|nr:hypothetical protein EXN66_Car006600 [Channa argus]
MSMEFIEGSRGICRPIWVLIDPLIYERDLQICWHRLSYKSQEERNSGSLWLLCVRRLWEFEMEDFEEDEQQEVPSSKRLWPVEVVMVVVPKVLKGFWLPPPNTCLNMPSKQLIKMTVGATKAIQDRVTAALSTTLHHVPFSCSIRDKMVLSIQGKVGEGYAQDILPKRLSCLAADILNHISDVAVK